MCGHRPPPFASRARHTKIKVKSYFTIFLYMESFDTEKCIFLYFLINFRQNCYAKKYKIASFSRILGCGYFGQYFILSSYQISGTERVLPNEIKYCFGLVCNRISRKEMHNCGSRCPNTIGHNIIANTQFIFTNRFWTWIQAVFCQLLHGSLLFFKRFQEMNLFLSTLTNSTNVTICDFFHGV